MVTTSTTVAASGGAPIPFGDAARRFDLASTGLANVISLATDGSRLWAGGSSTNGEGGRVAALDLHDGRLLYDVATPDVALGLAVDVGRATVWVVGGGDGADHDGGITRLDARTGAVRGTRVVHGGSPYGISLAASGAAWVTDASQGLLYSVDPANGDITTRVPVGSGPIAVAAVSGGAWVANAQDNAVIHVGSDGHVLETLTQGRASSVVATSTDIWIGGDTATHVNAAEPATPTSSIQLPAPGRVFGFRGGWVWTMAGDGTVRRINAESGVIDQRGLPGRGGYAGIVGPGALWIGVSLTDRRPAIDEYALPLPAGTPPPGEKLPVDGNAVGALSLDATGAIQADVVETIAGATQATAAAQIDGEDIAPGDTVPNDYYDRNRDGTLYPLAFASTARVTVLDGAPDRTRSISVEDLTAALRVPRNERARFYASLDSPFQITLSHGQAIALQQLYRR